MENLFNLPWLEETLFLLSNNQWLGLISLIFISFIIDRIFRAYAGKIATKLLKTQSITLTQDKKLSFTRPLGLMIFSGCFGIGLHYIGLPKTLYDVLYRISQIVMTVGGVWSSYKLVDVVSGYFQKLADESENKFDDILVPLVRKSLKVFVVCAGIILIGDSLTLNMKNILAGLGIGGLAFALAAKDTLSNLFGSLTVILDRPFQIGDWVLIGDKIEGTVVEVGFRSTRIRTFYDSLITVPNNQLTNIHIDNYGKRTYRRFTTKLGVQYDTPPEKIEAFCEGIRQLILGHKHTRKDYFHVYFSGFGDSALEIMVYVFWKVPDWSAELNEKHRLLNDILRLAQSMEIEFAFPTQTLHLFNENKNETLKDIKFNQAQGLAKEVYGKSITPDHHRSGAESFK